MEDFKPFEPYDFGEDREVVNAILVAALSQYGYPFDIAAGGRKELNTVDPVYMLQHAPALVPVFTVAAMVKQGKLSDTESGWMSRIAEGLLYILTRVHGGDEAARNQLNAIDKLIYPEKYELPKAVIEDLVEHYHTRPSLARGWRLREIMGRLSWVVEPARDNAQSVLDGAVKLLSTNRAEGHTYFDPVSKQNVSALEIAKKHWRRGVTLKNLAIRVYLEELQQQGFEAIDERSLKRDLKDVEAWEQTLPKNKRKWGVLVITPGKPNVHLPVGNYSEGWKQRKGIKQSSRSNKS